MPSGHHGIEPWTSRPSYQTYKSPYGPAYKTRPHFHGISLGTLTRFGTIAAGFGASAGIFALFFFGEVPKVRKDVMTQLPFVGDYFVREIPSEDNPF